MNFKEELNQISRSPKSVEDEAEKRTIQADIRDAEKEYLEIKTQLMEMAKNGKYQQIDGKKQIVL